MFAIGNSSRVLGRRRLRLGFRVPFSVLRPAALVCARLPAATRRASTGRNASKKMLILRGSDISGANLVDVDFTSTDLRDTNLLASNLEKATLVRASLADANAKGAKFNRIEAYRTDFSRIDAQGAIFASAEMQRSTFNGANLADVDFTKAELGRAEFGGATITGSRFELANLARADLRTAKFTGPIDFTSAFFFLTRIEGVDLSAANGLAQWQIDMACGDAATKLPGRADGGRLPGRASSRTTERQSSRSTSAKSSAKRAYRASAASNRSANSRSGESCRGQQTKHANNPGDTRVPPARSSHVVGALVDASVFRRLRLQFFNLVLEGQLAPLQMSRFRDRRRTDEASLHRSRVRYRRVSAAALQDGRQET